MATQILHWPDSLSLQIYHFLITLILCKSGYVCILITSEKHNLEEEEEELKLLFLRN